MFHNSKFLATGLGLVMAAAMPALAQGPGGPGGPGNHGDQRSPGNHGDQRGPGNQGDSGYVRHNDWKRGHRLPQADWGRGGAVDYRSHHLSRPPRGYEWRQIDGNYVMAAVATGVIASVIAASAR